MTLETGRIKNPPGGLPSYKSHDTEERDSLKSQGCGWPRGPTWQP